MNYDNNQVTTDHLIGENFLAFEMLELKACCNKTGIADDDDILWESNLNSAVIALYPRSPSSAY